MVWADSTDTYNVVAYRSSDGGRTWKAALEVSRSGNVQDPTLSFGPDGWAYLAEWGEGKMLLHRSKDGGSTWESPRELYTMDRPWIAVSGVGAEHEGRLYVAGNGGEGKADLAVVRAENHGMIDLRRTELNVTSGDRRILVPGNAVVFSDGTLAFPYIVRLGDIERYEAETYNPRVEREHNALLKIAVSADGGESFTTETVAPWYHRFGRGRTATMPSLAVDTSAGPFQDRLYVAWMDFRSGNGQVLLSHSDDRGQSWSEPIVVNREGGPAFQPELAVNEDGVLGISWYDRRNSPTGLGWSVRFAASIDGGVTVSRSTRVSKGAFRYSWDRGLTVMSRTHRGRTHQANTFLHSFNDIGGHTAGLAADANGTFHPFWVDNRTGVPQIWTAPVQVREEAVRHGAASWRKLQDVTSKTALAVETSRYDDSTGTVTMKGQIRNVSSKPLRAPLVLRVIDLWSEFGDVDLAHGTRTRRGHGAAFDLTSLLSEGQLPPDSATAPVTLRARIDSPKALGSIDPPPPGRRVPGYGLLQVRANVLGQVDQSQPPE